MGNEQTSRAVEARWVKRQGCWGKGSYATGRRVVQGIVARDLVAGENYPTAHAEASSCVGVERTHHNGICRKVGKVLVGQVDRLKLHSAWTRNLNGHRISGDG